MNWDIDKTVNDLCAGINELEYIADRMERRQERIEQMQAMTLALLAYIFLLIV